MTLINLMLEMVRVSLSFILPTLKFMHLNVHSPYPTFYTYLTLNSLCYLFKSFVWKKICFLNFTLLCFMLRILLISIFRSPQRKRKKNKKNCQKKTKKYIALKRRYKGAQKMAKDWLRKFKNQRLRFDNIFFY